MKKEEEEEEEEATAAEGRKKRRVGLRLGFKWGLEGKSPKCPFE